jgi:hypothetical protein
MNLLLLMRVNQQELLIKQMKEQVIRDKIHQYSKLQVIIYKYN